MPHHHNNMTLIGAPTLHNHTLSIQVNDNQDGNISGQFLNHTRTFAINLDRFTDEENLNPIGVDTPFKREMAIVMFVCVSPTFSFPRFYFWILEGVWWGEKC